LRIAGPGHVNGIPRATLFVLRPRSHATTDPETIKKIADTTAYVDAQYAIYAKAHPTE
jgi:hypothetical protein